PAAGSPPHCALLAASTVGTSTTSPPRWTRCGANNGTSSRPSTDVPALGQPQRPTNAARPARGRHEALQVRARVTALGSTGHSPGPGQWAGTKNRASADMAAGAGQQQTRCQLDDQRNEATWRQAVSR